MNKTSLGGGAGARALLEMVRAQKRSEPRGIWSVCSANPFVLEASLEQARADESALLVESTSNQVNPEGGYTGQTPADFARALAATAERAGFPLDRLILGGDHLGPFPWQGEPAASALAKSRELVRQCVLAGYEKIHLDASMACADDPGGAGGPLDERTVAERTADLAAVAEAAFRERGGEGPVYVVGTEVPTPGGEQQDQPVLQVTRPEDAQRFLELARAAFAARGLAEAWERVIALVVQPGVEFGDETIHAYRPQDARALVSMIEGVPSVVFEAHSTDYQSFEGLRTLVRDHFAILKVGPALTFALREAVFALAHVEEEWQGGRGTAPSGIRAALEGAMLARPGHWGKYYRGDEAARRLRRAFSFSDRIRYYWPVPEVQQALSRLLDSLAERPAPLTLLSQYLPWAYEAVRSGAVPNDPRALVRLRIREVTEAYARACTPTVGAAPDPPRSGRSWLGSPE
jgi:D-tagatose-1,6-bisphosphate aldolase subunit GatZ/KbaZ